MPVGLLILFFHVLFLFFPKGLVHVLLRLQTNLCLKPVTQEVSVSVCLFKKEKTLYTQETSVAVKIHNDTC